MEARFGSIGKKEIEMAKEKLLNNFMLIDGTWLELNIWFEKVDKVPKGYRGYAYRCVSDVLEYETIHALDVFENIADVEEYIKDFTYIFSDKDIEIFKNIFNEGKTAYMVDGIIGDNRENLCWNKIQTEQYLWKGSVEDAYHYLELSDNTDVYIELIVIGILNSYLQINL